MTERHQPIYFTPRNCPRVCFWPLPTTTAQDMEQFWANVSDRMVIAIEAAWFERVCTTQLYRYVMPNEPCTPTDVRSLLAAQFMLESAILTLDFQSHTEALSIQMDRR